MAHTLRVTAFTHPGKVRPANEDAIAALSFVRTGTMHAPVEMAMRLTEPVACLVADGMGGHASGEVASAHVSRRFSEVAPFLADEDAVSDALEALSDELYDCMDREPSLLGMGSTIVGLNLDPDRVLHFNVGDSRLYRFDGEYLVQISTDDNPGAAQVDEFGRPVESTTSLITQALGGSTERLKIAPHVGSTPLVGDEVWLLCSDGLSGPVPIEDLESALKHPGPEAVARLFDLAMQAGGPDNISIVLVRVTR